MSKKIGKAITKLDEFVTGGGADTWEMRGDSTGSVIVLVKRDEYDPDTWMITISLEIEDALVRMVDKVENARRVSQIV